MKRFKQKGFFVLLLTALVFSLFFPASTMAATEFDADSGVYDLIGGSTNDHSQALYLWEYENNVYVAIATAFRQQHNLYSLSINGVTVSKTYWLPVGDNLQVKDALDGGSILNEIPDGKASANYYWLVGKVAIDFPVATIVVYLNSPGGYKLEGVEYEVQGALNVFHEYPPAGPEKDEAQSKASNHIGGLAPGEYTVDPLEEMGYEYLSVIIEVDGEEILSVNSGAEDNIGITGGNIAVDEFGEVVIDLNDPCDKVIDIYYLYGLKKYTLTINYEYEDGTEAADSYVDDEKNVGDSYNVASPDISGYTPDEAFVSGTMPADDVTVTVVYTAIDYTLTINYEYEDGTEAADSYIDDEMNVGDNYSVTSPEISGYTPNQAVVSGIMPADDVTITVVYTALDYTLTLLVDPAGSGTVAALPDQDYYNLDDAIDISAIAEPGYNFINWTCPVDGIVSLAADFTYNMPARDVTLTANFEQIPDECDCEWIEETAWAAHEVGEKSYNPGRGGNWATYVGYDGEQMTVNLYAGQDMLAGEVRFSAPVDDEVTITIELDDGWRFEEVSENIKIQDYSAAPRGNPAPGRFAHKGTADPAEDSFEMVVPENNFYGIHVNVEWSNCVCD